MLQLVVFLFLTASLHAEKRIPQPAWYEGIDSVHVFTARGEADVDQAQKAVNRIWDEMQEDAHGNPSAFQKGQFGIRRRAIILKSGNYDGLKIPVNWYTSVIGVGFRAEDVVIDGFSSVDAYPGSNKGSLENFWKSVEGVTTTEARTIWAVSQGAPLRRSIIGGDLWLSESYTLDGNDGAHYTSGGFVADVTVNGELHWGAQQQFFYRNSRMAKVDYTSSGWSMVFVGVEGAPEKNKPKPLLSNVFAAPAIAEKPYLWEDKGDWFIVVPKVAKEVRGRLHGPYSLIPMEDVFVAKAGDGAETIQRGIQGKKALLLTPAIYGLSEPIYISEHNFTVLGIGMPTLVATHGLSAIVVGPEAKGVRVASVLLEAGSSITHDATEPLIFWRGAEGVASDLFARIGAFSYENDFHTSCALTKADVMARIDGDGIIMDNAWLWHADHDDCSGYNFFPKSNGCHSAHGLLVNGDDAVVYGLAVEHTKQDLVVWEGDNGQLFFFQSELPYNSNYAFGKNGHVGLKVGYSVQNHTSFGVGVYQVYNLYKLDVSIRMPSTANVNNMFAWCITGSRAGLGHLLCTSPGLEDCIPGSCDGNSCLVLQWAGDLAGDLPALSDPAVPPAQSPAISNIFM